MKRTIIGLLCLTPMLAIVVLGLYFILSDLEARTVLLTLLAVVTVPLILAGVVFLTLLGFDLLTDDDPPSADDLSLPGDDL